jgi:hypothetical protein
MEKLLMALSEPAIPVDNSDLYLREIDNIKRGSDIGYFAIMSPTILIRSIKLFSCLVYKDAPQIYSFAEKEAFFESNINALKKGTDPYKTMFSLRNLAKGVTGLKSFRTFCHFILQYENDLLGSNQNELLQYLGAFDPMHDGHIIAMKTALENSFCSNPYVAASLMMLHERKPYLSKTYQLRLRFAVKYIFSSNLINPDRISLLDFPGGIGLSSNPRIQQQIIAKLSGNSKIRWVIGGDKFRHDYRMAINDKETGIHSKHIDRFNDPNMEIYIVQRAGENNDDLPAMIKRCSVAFFASFKLMDRIPYKSKVNSSSEIRSLRNL